MKKLLLIILLPLSFNIYAENAFRGNFNLAAAGYGMNFSNSDYNHEIFAEFISAEIIHNYTNIGIGLSPLKYWSISFSNDDFIIEKQLLNFLNFNVNWDILRNKYLFLGPFCSINYFFFDNEKIKWNEYIFTSGIRFSWLFNIFSDYILYNFIGAEIGYRIINGQSNLHFNINFDLITFLYMIYSNGGYGFRNRRSR